MKWPRTSPTGPFPTPHSANTPLFLTFIWNGILFILSWWPTFLKTWDCPFNENFVFIKVVYRCISHPTTPSDFIRWNFPGYFSECEETLYPLAWTSVLSIHAGTREKFRIQPRHSLFQAASTDLPSLLSLPWESSPGHQAPCSLSHWYMCLFLPSKLEIPWRQVLCFNQLWIPGSQHNAWHMEVFTDIPYELTNVATHT